jgi:hypothetical protein
MLVPCTSMAAYRYVTQKDLAFFQYHVEQNGECKGASAWEIMMEKDIPNMVRYQAWRRTLPVSSHAQHSMWGYMCMAVLVAATGPLAPAGAGQRREASSVPGSTRVFSPAARGTCSTCRGAAARHLPAHSPCFLRPSERPTSRAAPHHHHHTHTHTHTLPPAAPATSRTARPSTRA